MISGCGALYLAGAAIAIALVVAVALDLGGMAQKAQRLYSRMPGGGQSAQFYRVMAAVVLLIVLGFGISFRFQITSILCH